MSKFLLVFLAVAAMTQVTHAQEFSYEQDELSQNSEVEIMSMNERRPGHGGGWGPGRPGPGRPGHGRPDPYPNPGPRPGPRPGPPGPRPPSQPYPPYPPPPVYRTEYVQCGAWDYRYNECYVNPYRIQSVRLYQQNSYDACIYGRTWGFNYDRLWTSGGCRGTFIVERYY